MKSLLGILIKSVLALVVFFGIALLALSFFANPERLKPYAIQYVQDKFQRTLSVGDISWRVFPKLGLSLDNVTLSDTPAFGNANFAAMKSVSVFVDTLSLLAGHVNVKTVEFVDVKANLKTTAAGVNSWDDLATSPTSDTKADSAEKAQASGGKGLSISDLSFNIEKIEIQNGEFNYVDDRAKSTYKITELNFQGENISTDKAFPVSMSFGLSSSSPAVTGKISAKASLKVPMKNGAVDKSGVTLEGTVDIPSINLQGIKISSLKAPVKVANRVLKLNGMTASFYGGSLGGNATIDSSSVPTKVSVDYNLKGVQMGPMLKDTGSKDTITGTLTMKGNVSFNTSADKKQTMRTLDGQGQMEVKNGVLKGVGTCLFLRDGIKFDQS